MMTANPIGYNVPGTYYGGDVSAVATPGQPMQVSGMTGQPQLQQPMQMQMQGMPVQGMQMSELQYEVQPQRKGKWKTAMLIAAFVIALLAFIGLIILAMVYGFGSHTNSKRPGWTIVNISTKNATLYAGGNDIFTMTTTFPAGTTMTVAPPTNGITTPYRSRVFIINNTANNRDLIIKASSNCTMVDNTETHGVIAAKNSAMYYWESASDTFVRLD